METDDEVPWFVSDDALFARIKDLHDQRIGSYFLHLAKGNSITLSVRMIAGIKHFPIDNVTTAPGEPSRYRLLKDPNPPVMGDIISLVEYYQTPRHGVPFILVKKFPGAADGLIADNRRFSVSQV